MNRPKRKWLIVGVSLLLLIGLYFIGVSYFTGHFFPGVKAGSIGIGQKTVETAQDFINERMNEQSLLFSENQEEIGWLNSAELSISAPVEEKLSEYLENQNPYLWPVALITNKDTIDISEDIQFDQAQLENLIPSLGIDNSQRKVTEDAKIIKNEDNSLTHVEEIKGNQISSQSLGKTLRHSLNKGETEISLEQAYVQPELVLDSEKMTAKDQLIEDILNTEMTLEFSDNSILITREQIQDWLFFDEDNQPRINQELVSEFLAELNQEYSGRYNPRNFTSTYQGVVEVPAGTYGWYINSEEEAPIIAKAIENRENMTRTPSITGFGYGQGDDIGGSYVEVDLTHQMMFIYIDNQLVLETPIVSGVTGAETVPGAYQVWSMQEDTDLTGYNPITERDYIQPVSYWIAFDNQAQGIHDASWQSSFGGDTHLTSGSLGCINTPPWVMGEVYELVEYGMPVMVFY